MAVARGARNRRARRAAMQPSEPPTGEAEAGAQATTCALCGRPLDGPVDRHHLVPRSLGGRETVRLHRLCHKQIHALLTDRALADYYHRVERLLEHDDIARFVTWVQRQPPSANLRVRRGGARRR